VWRVRRTALGTDALHWSLVDAADRVLSFEAIVRGWRGSERFRTFWCARLRDIAFGAWCWECPPVSAGTASRDFECVFVSCPPLARMPPDAGAFAGHFRADQGVTTFGNLGGDAMLVAPGPGGTGTDYSHLASFTATASIAQQDALWQAVGQAMEMRIGASPVWLNTAGHGIAWLHVRLDDRPKYYRHSPYAQG
jgi:Family of unknown function (DUF6940)